MDPSTTVAASGVSDMISSAGSAIGSGINVLWEQITTNPLLSLFIGFSIIGVAIAFFTSLKHA